MSCQKCVICQTKIACSYKKSTAKQVESILYLNMTAMNKDGIKLWPSRVEWYHNQHIKTTGKNKN